MKTKLITWEQFIELVDCNYCARQCGGLESNCYHWNKLPDKEGCVVCGCNLSLKGYCCGCQSRVDYDGCGVNKCFNNVKGECYAVKSD